MSCDRRRVKQSVLAYVILICWALLAAIVLSDDSFEDQLGYERPYSSRIRERRQQFPFPLDQIFQINAGEGGASSQVDFENDFSLTQGNTGNGLSESQDAAQQQQIQSQLPQVINNLIEAAAVQQPPVPQQLVRTVMNSGLRR